MSRSLSEFRRYPHPLVGLLCICLASTATASSESNGKLQFVRQDLVLPGAEGLVSLDYFAFDPINGRLWVPASNTGTVAIIDSRTGRISSISGFRTAQVEFMGKRPVMGPTSVSLGDGVAYVGNRGDSTVCAISLKTQTLGMCESIGTASAGLAAAPDALTYVAASRELWVTRGVPPMNVPSFDRAITVLDAAKPTSLRKKDTIPLGASAEGFAVDGMRGRFYTSLEEQGETVAIDVHSHKIVARWHSGCDEPHGLALDAAQGVLFVACMARVVSMDIAHDGHVLGSIETGSGLDNIDYLPSKHLLYAAAADAAQLTLARVDDHGVPHRIAVWPTQKGARGVVVDSDGNAFVMDPYGGRILKFTPQSSLDAR
jgi:DNA-binding beta-propeller fold protein YncE